MNSISTVAPLFIWTNIYLYYYQHCKPPLPNATDSQGFFLFHIFPLQAQYYKACNMTGDSIFINNLSSSSHKAVLHPLSNLLTSLIQL